MDTTANKADNPISAKYLDDEEKSYKFVKRSETTDVGKDYEDLKVAQTAIHLLDREDVADFRIWSNDANYGSFDDVIVIVESNTGNTTKVAIQLKHAANSNRIVTRNALTGPNGDFSLLKYFNDYQEAVKKKPQLADYILLLQTNRDICNEEMKLGEDLVIQPEEVNDPVAFLLSNNPESKPLRFTVKTSGKSDGINTIRKTNADNKNNKTSVVKNVKYTTEEFENFLKKLYYYPQQPNVKQTKTLCGEAFQKKFLSDEAKSFLDFVQEWSKRDGKKPKLSKELVSAKVAECLLSPFIRIYPEMKAENAHLFTEAIHQFEVTLIDEENATKLGCLWNEDELDRMEIDKENDFELKRRRFNWDQKDLQKLLWHLHERHLIVSLTEDNCDIISKALTLCQACGRRKFIFVTNGQLPNLPEDFFGRERSDSIE